MNEVTNARQQTLQHELASKLETVLSTIFSWECECYMIHGKKYNSFCRRYFQVHHHEWKCLNE